jgi:phosphoribosylamine-glycine ligase
VGGLVDELAVAYPDLRVFGPTKAAAQLEASKVTRLARLISLITVVWFHDEKLI